LPFWIPQGLHPTEAGKRLWTPPSEIACSHRSVGYSICGLLLQASEEDGVLGPGLEVLEHVAERRSHDPASVGGHPVL